MKFSARCCALPGVGKYNLSMDARPSLTHSCSDKTAKHRPIIFTVEILSTPRIDQSGISDKIPTGKRVPRNVVRYPRYLDTYRRYLRDDTSIAKVTIYRGIS